MRQARAYAAGKTGWTAGAMRTYYNKNAFVPTAGKTEKMLERTAGMDRCRGKFEKTAPTGVRG